MKIALLHNRKAGDQERTERELVKSLRRHGYEPTVLPPKRFLRENHAEVPGEFVVVAGGDGSVKRVACALAGSGRPMAILPIGTANNIAHSMGLTGPPEKIIAGWATGACVSMDLGIAHGPWGRRYFIEGLGLGLFGRTFAIMNRVDEISPLVLGTREERLYRDLCVLLALSHELQPVPLRLKVDRRRARSGRFLLCEVLNIRRSGPGVELSHSADLSDGFLDLVLVEDGERRKLLTLLEHCLAGKIPVPLLHTRRVRRVQLSLGDNELRIDDEVVWPPDHPRQNPRKSRQISVTVEVAPGALQCLLPRSAATKSQPRRK